VCVAIDPPVPVMSGMEPVPVIDAALVEDAEGLEEEEEEEEEEVELSQDADSSILIPARLHTEAKPDMAVSASFPQCLQM